MINVIILIQFVSKNLIEIGIPTEPFKSHVVIPLHMKDIANVPIKESTRKYDTVIPLIIPTKAPAINAAGKTSHKLI